MKSYARNFLLGFIFLRVAGLFTLALQPYRNPLPSVEGALLPLSRLGAQYVEMLHNIIIALTCLKL
jgi:hypothetical protein